MNTTEENPPIALTYDDVLLVPAYSEVLPHEVDVSTRLTREIALSIPIVSAAMDTVTEYRMAIAMAAEGGIGILHKNMSIDEQADQVRRVKRYESGLIIDPITLSPEATVRDAYRLMAEYKVGGIPITDDRGLLVGILTNRDIRFVPPSDEKVAQYMTPAPLVTVPEGTTLDQARDVLRRHRIEKLPVVDKAGRLVGLITYKDILKKTSHPHACKDHLGRLRVGAGVGVSADLFDRIEALIKSGVDVVCLDTAHAHSSRVLSAVRDVKARWPDLQLIAGNVATRQGATAVIEAGADAVKVGIGPGSICTTRIVTGVGVPQLTAVTEAYKAARETGVPLIADGGVKYSGDIVKALAAGADTIMAGNLFAGADESPGETILFEGRKFKTYRGMGSLDAMREGSKDRYFQDMETDVKKLVPEGVVGRVPYKGRVAEALFQLVGGLRAGMGYCGAPNIAALRNARMVRITGAGLVESHAHNVQITKEAPNYHR
ncbi:MAG: IMP dehydrogenase [Bacteroidia bacterium]|nr:IMP dehydrogenase [Bacteroidia bacterium]